MTEPVTEDGIESAWNACKYRGYCSRLHVENADVMVERDRLHAEVERLRADADSRGMFVARLEKMQEQGNQWLTIAAVLALLNDCDMLASRSAAAEIGREPK